VNAWENGPPAGWDVDSDAPPRPPRVWTPTDVIRSWLEEGPLAHQPTGIARLDDLTGGGPIFGSRWYVIGAPDAGKTALVTQLGHAFALSDVAVGFYAVDEEPGDLVTRIAQRAGWLRLDCEQRHEGTLDALLEKVADLPIRLYGPEHSIESAAADLAAFAEAQGMKAALFGDSIQAMRCGQWDPKKGMRENVTENVAAWRAVATRYRLFAMATSEMNRAAYRSIDAAEQANDMAAGKESGAIEFSARVMLSMRSVKDTPDLIEVRVVKNKHGPSGDTMHLRIDRRHMTLSEADAPKVPDARAEKQQKTRADVAADAEALAAVVRSHPGLSERALRASLRVSGQAMGVERLEAAKLLLRQSYQGARLVDRGDGQACAWHIEPVQSGGNS
jgi:KaiC/GvpD/RAD55 family RecA-like ATPase